MSSESQTERALGRREIRVCHRHISQIRTTPAPPTVHEQSIYMLNQLLISMPDHIVNSTLTHTNTLARTLRTQINTHTSAIGADVCKYTFEYVIERARRMQPVPPAPATPKLPLFICISDSNGRREPANNRSAAPIPTPTPQLISHTRVSPFN